MNTIQTKIGFDTKPSLIQNASVYEWHALSLKTLGMLLMSCSTFFSGGTIVLLKYYNESQQLKLQQLHEESKKLDSDHEVLVKEYEELTSLTYLQTQVEPIPMHKPSETEYVVLPRNVFTETTHGQ